MGCSHSGPGVATSPNSTAPAPGSKRCLGEGRAQDGGHLGPQSGFVPPLPSYSLYEIAPHRNNPQKSALTPHPSILPPPLSTGRRLTNMLDSFKNSPPLRSEPHLSPHPPPHGQVQPASRVRPSQSTPALDDRACAVLGTGEVKGWEGFPRTVRGRKEVPGPAKCPLDRSPKFFLGLPRDSAGVPSLAAGSFGEGMGFRWGLTLAARRRPGRSGQTPPSGPPPSPHPEASAPASARPGSAALPLPRPPRPLPAPPGLVERTAREGPGVAA